MLTKADRIQIEAWHQYARDIRFVGMYMNGDDTVFGIEALQGKEDYRTRIQKWSQVEVGGKFVVTGKTEGDGEIEWIIDPKRGWNAERVSFYAEVDGQRRLFNDCIVTLSEQEGVWFPETVTYSFDGHFMMNVVFHSRRLNRPDDPKQFTGWDLGLEPGMSVVPQDFAAPSRRGFRWTDEGLVPAERWMFWSERARNLGRPYWSNAAAN